MVLQQDHIILNVEQQRQIICTITSGKSWELAVSQHKLQSDALASELSTTLQRVLLVHSVHFVPLCA